MSLFVKLCGIKTESELETAVEVGADAVGFVLTPSPRQIPFRHAAHLNAMLPDTVLGVAVFHDPTPELLRQTREVVSPDLLQSEAGTLIGVPDDEMLPVVVAGERAADDLAHAAGLTGHGMVLVDSAARGGTGISPEWEGLAHLDAPARLILAGGLDPGNVAEAVLMIRPFGVDVSSGIEKAPGVKDPARMKAFVEAARDAAVEVGR